MVRSSGHAIAFAALALSVFVAPAKALTISEGETKTFEFTSLPETSSGVTDGALVTVSLAGNLLDEGEQIRLNAYENDVGEAPFFTMLFTTPTDQFGFHQVIPSTLWDDHQGVFTLTALLGSINLSFVKAVNFDAQGIAHSRTFDIAPVPLPSALLLFATGLGVMSWLARRRKRSAPGLAAC